LLIVHRLMYSRRAMLATALPGLVSLPDRDDLVGRKPAAETTP